MVLLIYGITEFPIFVEYNNNIQTSVMNKNILIDSLYDNEFKTLILSYFQILV